MQRAFNVVTLAVAAIIYNRWTRPRTPITVVVGVIILQFDRRKAKVSLSVRSNFFGLLQISRSPTRAPAPSTGARPAGTALPVALVLVTVAVNYSYVIYILIIFFFTLRRVGVSVFRIIAHHPVLEAHLQVFVTRPRAAEVRRKARLALHLLRQEQGHLSECPPDVAAYVSLDVAQVRHQTRR